MSDDFTENPWEDKNDTKTRDNHFHSSHDTSRTERETSTEEKTRGNRAAVANLPYAVRRTLDPHWSDWTLLSENESRHLVASDHCRFYTLNKRGRWEESYGRVVGSTAPWLCLERIPTDP